jgi:NADP-dependent 3-hydroxy acid dehydrogenase YdfG
MKTLVNNAAVAIAANLEAQTLAHSDAMVSLNDRGVFLLAHRALTKDSNIRTIRKALSSYTIYTGAISRVQVHY